MSYCYCRRCDGNLSHHNGGWYCEYCDEEYGAQDYMVVTEREWGMR